MHSPKIADTLPLLTTSIQCRGCTSSEVPTRLFTQHLHWVIVRHHFIVVPLVDQVARAFPGVEHLTRIERDDRVEESVDFVRPHSFFWSQDSPQTLRLLTSRTEVRSNLNHDTRFREIDGNVAHFGDEDDITIRANRFELLQRGATLLRGDPTVDEQRWPSGWVRLLHHFHRVPHVPFEGNNVVREDENFMALGEVFADEVRRDCNFRRVQDVQQHDCTVRMLLRSTQRALDV